MYSELTQWASRLVAHFMAQDFDAMTTQVIFPFPISVNGHTFLFHRNSELALSLQEIRQAVMRNTGGLHEITLRLKAVELPRKCRFRFWLDLMVVTELPSPVDRIQMLLYCHEADGVLWLDMVEAQMNGLPDWIDGRLAECALAM